MGAFTSSASSSLKAIRRLMDNAARGPGDSLWPVHLGLYASAATLTKAVRKIGERGIAVGLHSTSSVDLSNESVISFLMEKVRQGRIAALFADIPSSSFTKSRRRDAMSCENVLSIADFPEGPPSLCTRRRFQAETGNVIVTRSFPLLSLAIECSIPVFIQNPHKSMLWVFLERFWPDQLPQRIISCFDFCAFGARWRKRIGMLQNHLSRPCTFVVIIICVAFVIALILHRRVVIKEFLLLPPCFSCLRVCRGGEAGRRSCRCVPSVL
jgi:hypothetical protein